MMKNRNLELARILVDSINSRPLLFCRLSSDFSNTSKIEISCFLRPNISIGEFVFYQLSLLESFHLKLVSVDDSSNISYWKVV